MLVHGNNKFFILNVDICNKHIEIKKKKFENQEDSISFHYVLNLFSRSFFANLQRQVGHGILSFIDTIFWWTIIWISLELIYRDFY